MTNRTLKILIVVLLALAIWVLNSFVPFIITTILVVILSMGTALYLIKNGDKNGKALALALMVFSTLFLMYSVNKKEDSLKYMQVKNLTQLNKIIGHSKKPVMIDFWATWCVSCIELDKITFKDSKVKEELSKYLLVKVDVSDNTEEDKVLMQKFDLFGPPALIFFKDGKEEKNKRIMGFKTPEEFLKVIK